MPKNEVPGSNSSSCDSDVSRRHCDWVLEHWCSIIIQSQDPNRLPKMHPYSECGSKENPQCVDKMLRRPVALGLHFVTIQRHFSPSQVYHGGTILGPEVRVPLSPSRCPTATWTLQFEGLQRFRVHERLGGLEVVDLFEIPGFEQFHMGCRRKHG